MIHNNLKHDSISHNRGYSQSKTTTLAAKHIASHNHKPKLNKHDSIMRLRAKLQEGKEKVQTWIDCNEWSTKILEFDSHIGCQKGVKRTQKKNPQIAS